MRDLFSNKNNIQIIRIDNNDVKIESDSLVKLKSLILSNEKMYPNIDKWYSEKVKPGLKNSQRIAYIGLYDDIPIISAVVKKGRHSKFCHLKIDDKFQSLNLGDIFFTLMALEVRNIAEEIHFTLSENLWSDKKQFFESFGFNKIIKSETQYRNGIEELKCSAPFKDVWKNVRNKLSKLMYHFSIGGYSHENHLLLSIKPEFANKVLSGEKTIELRKKFSKKWQGHNTSIYASSPVQAILGYATIEKIIDDKPENIWSKYKNEIGVTEDEFYGYTVNSEKIYAIKLKDVHAYPHRFPLIQISYMLEKDLTPPQSYLSLGNNQAWNEAISLTTILNANFSKRNNIMI